MLVVFLLMVDVQLVEHDNPYNMVEVHYPFVVDLYHLLDNNDQLVHRSVNLVVLQYTRTHNLLNEVMASLKCREGVNDRFHKLVVLDSNHLLHLYILFKMFVT